MAAEEQLLVIYSGADPRTGTKRPPAVPIGELLDVIDLTAVGPDGGSLRRQVVTAHALQPFDAKNFVVRDLTAGTDAAFSFDRAALRGAQAAIGVRSEPPTVFDATDLPPLAPPDSVALEELLRFYKHPLKALMRIRAGLYVSSKDDQVSDDLPVTLDGLESWAIGDRVLARVLEGVDLRQAVAAEWRRGQLPPRAFGARTVDPIVATVTEIIESARRWVAPPAGSRDVRAHVGNRTVVGTCSAVHGDSLVSVGYSRLSAQHRLQSWVRLLALTVTAPDRPWTAVTIGRGGRSILGPVPVALAASSLADLVALYDTGLNDPLPFAAKTSAEYARLAAKGSSVETMAAKLEREWDRERDAAYDFFFGPSLTYSALTEAPPIPAEARGGMAERSRFGTLARRVFHPLLMSEELR
jgi:exodeoxyribonuclease V gamma subunit